MKLNELFQETSGGMLTGFSNLFHGEWWRLHGEEEVSGVDSQVQGSSTQVNAGAIC